MRLLLVIPFLFLFNQLRAQDTSRAVSRRQVGGTVKDSVGEPVHGANVMLVSEKDSLISQTDERGHFFFSAVESAIFDLTVSSLGYRRKVLRYRYNDSEAKLELDPVTLKAEITELDEVVVNSKVGVVFKTDTVEFTASDYQVQKYDKVDELIKKMEGVVIDADGKVMFNGKEVKKARFNGVDYFGGDIASAISELPADVVSKIQVIDDYGKQAEMTGVKKGEPDKVLNVVTKADKSAGKMYMVGGNLGTNKNLGANATLRMIDGPEQRGAGLNFSQSPAGIMGGGGISSMSIGMGGGAGMQAPTVISMAGGGGGMLMGMSAMDIGGLLGQMGGGGGVSGGTNKRGGGDLSYGTRFGENITLNTNYRFNLSDNHTLRSSVSQENYQDGLIQSINDSENDNNSQNHTLSANFEDRISKQDRLSVNANLNYNRSKASGSSASQQSGVLRVDQYALNENNSNSPSYQMDANYMHSFAKEGMNFSARLSVNNSHNNSGSENRNNLRYFDMQSGELQKDSLQYTSRDNHTKNNRYELNTTFSYPLSKQQFLDISAGYNYNGTDNEQLAKDLSVPGQTTIVDSLSRFFDYSYEESPLSINYRYQSEKGKMNLTVGLKGVGTWMQGNYEALGSHVDRSSFNLVPEFQLGLTGAEQQQWTLRYSADAQQPDFEEVQPVRDVTDPLNPIVGNPDLATAFRHQANIGYNQFMAKKSLSIMANVSANFTRNKVVRNQVLLEDVYQSIRRETRFVNMNGDYGLNGNYFIRKGFKDNKYNVQLSGMMGYSHAVSMTDNVENIGRTWMGNQRFSLSATPNKWLDLSANLGYNLNKTDFSLKEQNRYLTQTWTSGITGRLRLPADLQWNTDLTKNFVSGINNNITNNPLVINTDLSKRLLKSRELVLSVRVNDLLKQNNFVNRRVTDNGIIDSKSNTNSRFAVFSLYWMPQKWGMGRGMNMPRRGDGSAIRMR